MPTYQYSCTECGHFFEQVQSFSDASLTECPACQGKLRKVFNAVGVVFKGSGFYRTDSRTDSGSENGSKTPVGAGSASKDGAKASGSQDSGSGGGGKDSSSGSSGGGKDSGGAKSAGSATAGSSGGSSSRSGGTSTSGSAA